MESQLPTLQSTILNVSQFWNIVKFIRRDLRPMFGLILATHLATSFCPELVVFLTPLWDFAFDFFKALFLPLIGLFFLLESVIIYKQA